MKKLILSILILTGGAMSAQENPNYWQQHVDYKMDIDMNVNNFQYTGSQELKYTNNSPDTLKKVFYHLFFNAFQPGSDMDMRLQDIADPDGRMVNNLGTKEEPKYQSRISILKPNEIGYLRVESLDQDGKKVEYKEEGTILKVSLAEPIAPGKSTTFKMKFKGQVPVQIRRSGRNNADGVALSMTQWYPKLAEYDFEGWHADPYIAREFFGVWGDFDVNISIDKKYILGGTGVLQNADEIGYGYEKKGTKVKRAKGDKLTWNFKAEKVHDFAWAADPEYIHDSMKTESGVTLHFLYKNDPKVKENWKKIQPETAKLLAFYNEHIGEYPWKQYSVIQGGDGGMEYANCTLITGGENYDGLLGTTAHEFAHSWFQQLLGTNESQHPWMDEGFTSYISTQAEQSLEGKNSENPYKGSYRTYNYLAQSGKEQALSTHGDRYEYNMAYSIASYVKGSVFLSQLGYIIGKENLQQTLHSYYDEWKFKHPSPNDFIRVAEKVSGAELNWYLNDWVNTTNTIDYAVKNISEENNATTATLERVGIMPMPLDVTVSYTDGTSENIYIPLSMMQWEKPAAEGMERTVEKDWSWAQRNYDLKLNKPKSEISKIEIDAAGFMADVDRSNNIFPAAAAE
ncbi:Peptidase family M1 [Gillisia sp. Hel1_33_143]|uniref:M1 family metallopeptidase n=1 Tax=Gillisia sp. Hel1_33_143 TaxID=1336796 RepID=UPI00087954A4|nr:M1 family metallopeptidase [Gillisia sp. Hel1_33_143]SDR86341.1 Peptidase family M1 [Gillisia sp. Hel1_33_143]